MRTFLRGMTRHLFFLFLIVVFLFLIGGPLSADSIMLRDGQKDLQHEVTVTLKLIQVYVTDKEGKPVMDLEKDDFEIYDRGKLRKITEFEKHLLSLPDFKERTIVDKIQPDKLEPTFPTTKMNRKFFLFFDFAFNNPVGIKKAKKAALHFIDTQLKPTDEVGVLSYSTMRGLVLHEFLTNNHQIVRNLVEAFGLREVLGRAEDVEEQYWKAKEGRSSLRVDEESAPFGSAQSSGLQQFWGLRTKNLAADREIYKQQARNFISKINDLAKAFNYIPGHKNIILFSSGISSSLPYWRYEEMLKKVAASNSPVFAVNTEDPASSIHKDETWMGVRSLKRFAKVTGGKYFTYVQDYEKTMEEIDNSTGSYYILGYYIDEKWDGKYHKIKVKVKKKEYKVHAQGGYYNPKPFTEYSELEKKIHLVDLALTERPLFQDPLRFSVKALHRTGEEGYNLLLASQIQVEKLNEISGGNVEIVSLVFDEKDNIIGLKRGKIEFSKIPEKEFQAAFRLSLPPGKYKCRVVIRNLETGRGAIGAADITIPEG